MNQIKKEDMYCFQCQEANNNIACTVLGMCGKSAQLASIMDVYKASLIGLSKVVNQGRNENLDVETGENYIVNGLFKLITNANFDQKVFLKEINEIIDYREELAAQIDNGNKNFYQLDTNDLEQIYEYAKEVRADQIVDQDIRGMRELIITGLMGMAAYYSHANNLGYSDKKIAQFISESLAKMDGDYSLNDYIELSDQVGKVGIDVMALLDIANSEKLGTKEISTVNIGVGKRPGILVSGHDLNDLEQLLEQSKDAGIDIYTHSEMLPAHYYPKLKKYKHLFGNYGNAWYLQTKEFQTFNGPILFTTNCIVPPKNDANYKERVFTTGNCGFDGFKHVSEDRNGKKDFTEIINLAKECKAPKAIEQGNIIGGFGHQQTVALSEQIINEITQGNITNFVVMAGCDGRNRARKYYEEFALGLKDSAVILTAGCAKYRYNKLNLGEINGIPRVLDAGQCNDSYSLAVIAMTLQEKLGLNNINDLPITYNIAWYEQKAVIVLLSLLHLGIKNIHIGPSLPAFLTPTLITFLNETYGLSGITNAKDDLQVMGLAK